MWKIRILRGVEENQLMTQGQVTGSDETRTEWSGREGRRSEMEGRGGQVRSGEAGTEERCEIRSG